METSTLFATLSAAAMLSLFYYIWWREEPRIAKARAMIRSGAPLIDVDDPREFARNHIDGAKNIPLQALTQRADEIGPVDRPVVVYGRGKLRAARAAHELRAIGFHDVLNIGRARW